MTKAQPSDSSEPSEAGDLLAYLAARRAANRPQPPSVLNLPDGAYLAVALVAVAALIVAAWRPTTMPLWMTALPAALLLAGFTMKGVFGALMLYEGWTRWRKQRMEDEGNLGGGPL
jgi:fatty acid desaturase